MRKRYAVEWRSRVDPEWWREWPCRFWWRRSACHLIGRMVTRPYAAESWRIRDLRSDAIILRVSRLPVRAARASGRAIGEEQAAAAAQVDAG